MSCDTTSTLLTLPRGGRFSPSTKEPIETVGISKDLKTKIALPLRSLFRISQESYLDGELDVRSHNGLFFGRNKKKTCVLLKSGWLFIYSGLGRGLSLDLCKLRKVKEKYSDRGTVGASRSARLDIELHKDNQKLGITIKGDRQLVAAWRRGFVSAHQGVPLGESGETDEIMWSQPQVDATLSTSLLYSLDRMRSLRSHTLPSSLSFYGRSHSLLSKSMSTTTPRKVLPHSKSFCSTATRAHLMPVAEAEFSNVIDICTVDAEERNESVSIHTKFTIESDDEREHEQATFSAAPIDSGLSSMIPSPDTESDPYMSDNSDHLITVVENPLFYPNDTTITDRPITDDWEGNEVDEHETIAGIPPAKPPRHLQNVQILLEETKLEEADWRESSMFAKLPMLRAELLQMDAVFGDTLRKLDEYDELLEREVVQLPACIEDASEIYHAISNPAED